METGAGSSTRKLNNHGQTEEMSVNSFKKESVGLEISANTITQDKNTMEVKEVSFS